MELYFVDGCHDYLEQLPDEERESINNELRRYKANFFITMAEITTEGIEQVEVYQPEEPEEVISIPAYDFTEEEYPKYLEARRKRELEKPRWKEKE